MNRFSKSAFRPPVESKKGFKPPTRALSQESSTPASVNNKYTSESSLSQPRDERKPLEDISNTSNGSGEPKGNEPYRPSIIWDSQGSQPMPEVELPDWAKGLPDNSESFMDRTTDPQLDNNMIDISIFDAVLRNTLDGEKTEDGRLLADIRPGVEVTHESPTIWSSQEISNRLSQSQKSNKSSQSQNMDIYTQVMEKSKIDKRKEPEESSDMIGDDKIVEETPAENQLSSQKSTKSSQSQNMDIYTQGMEKSKIDKRKEPEESSDMIDDDKIVEETPAKNHLSSQKSTKSSQSQNMDIYTEVMKKSKIDERKEPGETSDMIDDEIVEETPVKNQLSSRFKKFDGLSPDSDSGSDFDAIDEHVFSQVMSQLNKSLAAYEKNNDSEDYDCSADSEDEEDKCQKVGNKGDCNDKLNSPKQNAGKKSSASPFASEDEDPSPNIHEKGNDNNRHQVGASFKSNEVIPSTSKSLSEKDRDNIQSVSMSSRKSSLPQKKNKQRTLYHKALMKRHKDLRQTKRSKEKGLHVFSESTKAKSNQSLKKRLFDLQSSRDEAVWVECCNSSCKKWRYLKDVNDPAELPNAWFCNMNPDFEYNTCSMSEQNIGEVGDKLEAFVECQYTVGSVVWARVVGESWWPAMIDDDPDTEEFYWTDDLEDHFSIMVIPSWYHVVFYGGSKVSQKVERAWVRIEHLRRFKPGDPVPRIGRAMPAQQEGRQKEAIKIAECSLRMDLFQRRKRYSFIARYHGKWGKPIDWEDLEEDD